MAITYGQLSNTDKLMNLIFAAPEKKVFSEVLFLQKSGFVKPECAVTGFHFAANQWKNGFKPSLVLGNGIHVTCRVGKLHLTS